MKVLRIRFLLYVAALVITGVCGPFARLYAAEVAQGSFEVTLDDTFVCDFGGGPYASVLTYDDMTFNVDMPSNGSVLAINLGELGPMAMTGNVNCVFDEGGTFATTGSNEAGDFHWIDMTGEYLDRVPGIAEGDPFPFVGRARCSTTRGGDLQTLCENFELSFNGLGKALPPNPRFTYYAGDFTFRATERTPVDAGAQVSVDAAVDGPGGDLPEVGIHFANGVEAPGTLVVATLAEAHGSLPSGFDLGVRGTTSIDHGSGAVPFFAGGDERFVEISTDAALPSTPTIEVCLPMPDASNPANVRPVRVLHGEGTGVADRKFKDRTSRVDASKHQACARVKSFSKFAVATTDVSGGGQAQSDGLVTTAGGLIGKRSVVVDGLTDCTQYPANLPRGLARHCVPDADAATGQCGLALTLGVNRAASNRSGQPNPFVDVGTYMGTIGHGAYVQDLTPAFGPLIAALSNPVEATVGPVQVSLPVDRRITTYTLRHQLSGLRPISAVFEIDKDVLKVKCIDPSQF
jgi:hypothetical protein